jgi:predicted nucleic acid-binding protein
MKSDKKRFLVDTSAWIASFRSEGDPKIQDLLKQAISADQAAIAPVIILELIQGCKTRKERDLLRLELDSLELLDLDDPVWERAYSLAFDLRRNGLTIPAIDILIIALALENDCFLLHSDRHFAIASQHVKDLEVIAIASI